MTADRAALVRELHARRLAAHGLDQREHGDAGLHAALDEVLAADAAEVFAAALGVLFRSIDPAAAAHLAGRIRTGIPPLIAEIEGTQPK